VGGRAYNVGCGVRTTLNELVAMLGRASGGALSATHGPPREGDVRDSVADIALARRELGFAPKIGVEEGLGRLLAHLRAER
jgi:nucleoside-diphosphate-sugar epimerase